MEFSPAIRPISWVQFRTEVLRLYREPMRARGTARKADQVLREFAAYCPTTAALTEGAISDWIVDHPGRARAYVDGLLRHLSAACTYGASPGRRWLVDPFDFRPVSSWLPADGGDDRDEWPRHRTAEEVRRVLDRADQEAQDGRWRARRLRAAIYCWAFTGATRSEILGLRVRDIDLADRVLWIRSHERRRLKTRARSARLPIAAPLAAVLESWLPNTAADGGPSDWAFPHCFGVGPWFSGRPGRRPLDEVRALGERAGVPGLTILAFRHTMGTLAEGWGVGELMLQRILRHARRETQLHYRHADLQQMERALSLVRF